MPLDASACRWHDAEREGETMLMNRRTWLGGVAAAGTVALMPAPAHAVTIAAPGASPAFRAALDALAATATADLAANGFPGMTLSVRAGDGQTATIAVGDAVIGREPVRAEHLFQIGSISKSFVAMALYVLAGQGKLDLDAPVVAIVPELWLADRSITLTQLLAHSAGLPDGAPFFPDVPGGRLWSATPPGSHFAYSNSGYDMLAFVIERASGMRYDHALEALVLRPLGMTHAEPVIRSSDRARYAQGYAPLGDMPWFARGSLAEGPWLDIDRAAGSVAATSGDMLRYIAFLGRLAQGRGAPLFSDALAVRFATPVIDTADFGKGARYANGLATVDIDGAPTLHHTGGMLLFSSAVYVDRASGAGVFASVNIASNVGYRPRAVTQYGVRLLRAAAAGKALPPAAPFVAVPPIEHAADFAGRFVGPRGDAIVVEAAGTTLTVVDGLRRGRVKPVGDGSFLSDLPGRSDYLLTFTDGPGPRRGLWYDDTLYGRDSAVAQPAAFPALAALAGTYLSNDLWIGGTAIIARGDTLIMEGAGPLHRAADGSWRMADPLSTERIWFDHPVAGRPQRLNFSGSAMWRTAV